MAAWYQKIIHELAETRRKTAHMIRPGVVSQVQKGKCIVDFGAASGGAAGQYLSPWLDTSHSRGDYTEHRVYSEKQNFHVICPDGDPAKGFIVPFAPNSTHCYPAHRDAADPLKANTSQFEDMRMRRDKDQYDNWLAQSSGGAGGAGGAAGGAGGAGGGGSTLQPKGDTSCGEGTKAVMKTRMDKKGYLTGRVGVDARYAAHKEGAKIKMKKDYFVAYSGLLIVSKPPIIGKDPIPDDNK